MTGEKAFRLLDGIDDSIIAEAEAVASLRASGGRTRNKREHKPWPPSAIAACLCVVALTVYLSVLALGNGWFDQLIGSVSSGPARTEAPTKRPDEPDTEPDMRTPDDPLTPLSCVNPYAGMTEDTLIDLFRENDRGSSRASRSFNTPFYFFYRTDVIGDDVLYRAFDKLTGETVAAPAITGEDLCRPVGNMLAMAVGEDRLYFLMLGYPMRLYSARFDLTDARLEFQWRMDMPYADCFLHVNDGCAFLTTRDEADGFCTYRIDLAARTMTAVVRPDGLPVPPCSCAYRQYLFYTGDDGSLYRYDTDTDEDDCLIRDGSGGTSGLYILPDVIGPDDHLLRVHFITPMQEHWYLWYDMRTGETTPSVGGLVIGDREVFVRCDLSVLHPDESLYTVFSDKPDYGELWQIPVGGGWAERLMTVTFNGCPGGLKTTPIAPRLFAYDGKCLYLQYDDVSDPRGIPVTRTLVVDVETGTVCSRDPSAAAVFFPDGNDIDIYEQDHGRDAWPGRKDYV